MKRKYFFSFILMLLSVVAYSQDSVKKDTAWKFGGQFVFTLSQASFSDWAAGGENNYSGNSRLSLHGNYVKGAVSWENNIDMAYGKAKQGEQGLRKTDDKIELNSKFGLKASKKWFYTAVLNAKTQFDDGFKYSKDTTPDLKVSEAFAPFYLNLAVGADYKPNKYTSVFLSPINSKIIYVNDELYSPRYSIDSGSTTRIDVGAIVKFKYERELIKNLNFLTKLDLFANYKELKEINDVDVNWEVLFTMRVFKVLSINLNTHLLWDKDVKSVGENGELGDAKVQFKEIFGAGLTYMF